MIVKLRGYLVLISIDFYDFNFRFLLNYTTRIFNSLLGVYKCDLTQSFVFDILLYYFAWKDD